jgi:DNA-directed RNA polymerase specialized sigma24 family protein
MRGESALNIGVITRCATSNNYYVEFNSRKEAQNMADDRMESTNKLLRVIIALLLRGKDEQSQTLKQNVERLHVLGLRPAEIAQILGKTSGHVNKELSGIRKARK